MRRPVRIAFAAVVPALVLALAACSAPAPLPTPSAIPSSTPSPTPTVAARSVPQIAAAALRAVGTGTVASVADESAGTVWDVQVVLDDGEIRELHLSPAGRVLAGPSSVPTSEDVMSTNRSRVAAASISLSDAVDRMRAAVPGGTVTAVELAQYRDRVVWQGDVTDADGVRHDVRIDAVNGAVLLDLRDGQGAADDGQASSGGS